MLKTFFTSLLLSVAGTLVSCQQTSSKVPAAANVTPASATTLTEAEARAAVGRYLQSQPNTQLYVLDSARVNNNEASWQVLVPRTDWAGRMHNRARFEVDKASGSVRTVPVK